MAKNGLNDMIQSASIAVIGLAVGSAMIAGSIVIPVVPEIVSVSAGWVVTAAGALNLLGMVGINLLK